MENHICPSLEKLGFSVAGETIETVDYVKDNRMITVNLPHKTIQAGENLSKRIRPVVPLNFREVEAIVNDLKNTGWIAKGKYTFKELGYLKARAGNTISYSKPRGQNTYQRFEINYDKQTLCMFYTYEKHSLRVTFREFWAAYTAIKQDFDSI